MTGQSRSEREVNEARNYIGDTTHTPQGTGGLTGVKALFLNLIIVCGYPFKVRY